MRRSHNGRANAAALAGAVIVLLFANDGFPNNQTNQPSATDRLGATNDFTLPKTLAELMALRHDQVENVDIGLIDLLCAEGLRGSEDLNIQQCLKTLDTLAEHVKSETERNHYRFRDHPEHFLHSQGYFRMKYLATILQQDLGIRYSPERAAAQRSADGKIKLEKEDLFFADSRDVFIHGLLGHKHFGTCASMPVLYVAIARRLGYPVRLATTQAHFYVRYEEDDGKHLNVEATCVGFKTFSDQYYKNWPFPISEDQVNKGHHLRPLNNRLVLGRLLIERAGCLTSMKRFDEAAEIWRKALPYLPELADAPKYAERAGRRRDAERWYALWNDVALLVVLEGPGYSYFRNRKVQIHTFMAHSADIAEMEKLVLDLKAELDDYHKQIAPISDGRVLPIAVWPLEPDQLPQPIVPPELVRLKHAIPQLMPIPMEMIPQQYWRGMPQELQARLQTLTRDEDVVNEMHLFAAEELKRFNEASLFAPRPRALPLVPERGELRPKRNQIGIPEYHITIATGQKIPFRADVLPEGYRDSLPSALVEHLRTAHLMDKYMIHSAIWHYAFQENNRRMIEAHHRALPTSQSFSLELARTNAPSPPHVRLPLTPQPQSPITAPALGIQRP